MHPGVVNRLLLLALAAPLLVQSAAQAGKDNKKVEPPAVAPLSKECEGKARVSREEAIELALEVARDQVSAYLQEQKPSVLWRPDAAYVREHLLEDIKEPSGEWSREELNGRGILVKTDALGGAVDAEIYQVRLRVGVNTQQLAEIRRVDQPYRETLRHAMVQQRQLWLGKMLLGVVVLLAAISGYIRLEDATKGFYTGLLRLGMVGVLCAVGAGLWLVS